MSNLGNRIRQAVEDAREHRGDYLADLDGLAEEADNLVAYIAKHDQRLELATEPNDQTFRDLEGRIYDLEHGR